MTKQKPGLLAKSISSILWSSLSTIAVLISKTIVLIVLARLISPQEFGIVGVSLIVVNFSKMFSQLGLGPALVQRSKIQASHIHTAFFLNIILGIFFSAIIFLSRDLIALFFEIPEVAQVVGVLAITVFIRSLYSIPLAMLQRNLDFKIIAFINSCSYIIGYGIVGIIFALLGYGLWALVYATFGELLLTLILVYVKSKERYKLELNLNSLKDLYHFALGQTSYQITNFFALEGDNLIIGKILGSEALGLYGRAYQLVSLPARLFSVAIGKVLFPAFSKIQAEQTKIHYVYINGIKFIATITLPLSFCILIIVPELIFVLLGTNWMEASLAMQILSSVIFFRLFYAVNNILLKSIGKVFVTAKLQSVYGIMILLFGYLGSYYDIAGVAAGVALSIVTHSLLVCYFLMKKINLKVGALFKHLVIPVQFSLIFFGILYIVVTLFRNLELHSIVILVLTVLIFSSFLFWGILNFREKLVGELAMPVIKKYSDNYLGFIFK